MTDTIMFKAGELTFAAWKEMVDAEFDRVTTFSSDDFPDWGYADAFADGVEPADAARRALAQDPHGREFLELAGINPDEIDL